MVCGMGAGVSPDAFQRSYSRILFEKVDPNIKDAKGYNAELGFRGNWRF
ncbi:MAG: hypothetical protein WDN26_07245 [Chitinophagaceae bacterium]